MKKVVTGAAGFIGSNLVRALLNQGRDVRGIDSLVRGSNRCSPFGAAHPYRTQ